MPNQSDKPADGRAIAVAPASGSLPRREPGLATLFLGLAVMILALILPQEHRILAFYPAVAVIAIGTILTLRRGPDRSKDGSR